MCYLLFIAWRDLDSAAADIVPGFLLPFQAGISRVPLASVNSLVSSMEVLSYLS